MGLILFANINTFTMSIDDDNDQDQQAKYRLACGICHQQMDKPYECIKRVFHSACMKQFAIVADQVVPDNAAPWTISHASTTNTAHESTIEPTSSPKKTWGKHWKTRKPQQKRWSK